MPKILYIEDELLMQNIVNKILLREGYTVDVANNGKEAMELLIASNYEYSLVITDIMMPYSNGFEILSKIKNHNNAIKIPVIVVSGLGNEDAILEAFKLGADDFLKKPIMAGELLVKVKRLIG